MGQIEKHSKIAIGLRQGHSTSKTSREKNGYPYRTASQAPIEQLDIFS
jgi:hypothetical protein